MYRGLLALVLIAAGAAVGFVVGRATGTSAPEPNTPALKGTKPRPVVPHPTLAEQNTEVVGGKDDSPDDEDSDGNLILRPAGAPRVLTFDAEDADLAEQLVNRFVDAVSTQLLTERGPGTAVIRGVRLAWRTEGDGPSRALHVAAIPVDPYMGDEASSRLAEAIGEFTIVNGCYPTTVTRFEDETAAVTAVRVPRTAAKIRAFEAAEQEFKARGLELKAETVAMSTYVELVRDAHGSLLWTFSWEEDQGRGTYHVRHHADPLDTKGEQEILLAVMRRSLGRDVRIRSDVSR